jgi:hypothetical protein
MAAHLHVTSIPSGITLASGAEADDVSDTSAVEIAELIEQDTGHIIKASPVNMKTRAVEISGDGPATLTDVATGTVGTVSDLKVNKVEITEAPNKRCTFSLSAAAVAAFTDPAASPSAAGAEPDIDDLEIVSVEYAVAESVRRGYEVEDMTLPGSDGAPYARARTTRKGTFSIAGRGDRPAGAALGTGGAAFSGSDTGLVVVSKEMDGQKRKEWNRWSLEGNHYPNAA